jgi:hypothetical protein
MISISKLGERSGEGTPSGAFETAGAATGDASRRISVGCTGEVAGRSSPDRPDVLRNEGKEGKEGGSLRRAGFRKWEGSEKGRREGGTNQLSGTSKVFSWPGEASQPVGASGVEPEPVKRAGH